MDLVGKRFGKLVAHSDADESGLVLCECDCGEVVLATQKGLLSGRKHSCGCSNRNHQNLFVEKGKDKVSGTSIGRIVSKNISKNNKTGVRGVWYDEKHGKYEAYIYFQHKKIHLGLFDKLGEAAAERERAEEKYYAPVLQEYAAVLI